MKTLLVRPPATSLPNGQTTHIERVPITSPSPGAVASLRRRNVFRGWKIVSVERIDEAPDSVFVEDAVIMFGRLAVLQAQVGFPLSEVQGAQPLLMT